jgi:inorganic pyrophosphatase
LAEKPLASVEYDGPHTIGPTLEIVSMPDSPKAPRPAGPARVASAGPTAVRPARAVGSGAFPEVVEVVVEIPRGSRNKYEFDEATGAIRLDRVLSAAVFYPQEYGFVDGTRAGDGDHTDAIVLIDEATFPGCRITARPIGVLLMHDEKGPDEKILCVAVGDPHYSHVHVLADVSSQKLREVEHFFATYKLLEDKTVDVDGWADVERARELLTEDRLRYEAEH